MANWNLVEDEDGAPYPEVIQEHIRSLCTDAKIEVLRQFAEHSIHDVIPHSEIANSWYHSGLDAAQDEARRWVEELEENPRWPLA